ncbi:MAG: UMP kinase [Candidatus Njordarchaeia archaeon]
MDKLQKIVVKIGGSILFPNNVSSSYFLEKIEKLADFIREAKEYNNEIKIFIVVGGGSWAKNYIGFARDSGIPPIIQDLYGITISRLNANMVMYLLEGYLPEFNISRDIPGTPEEAYKISRFHDVMVLGGFYPGQSTIGTAALLAEIIKADLFLIATDVNGVYQEDPKKNPNAKKYDRIHVGELLNLLVGLDAKPGTYKLIDLVALKTIQRAKIPTIIMGARDMENLKRIFKGYVEGKTEEIYKYGTIVDFG